MHEILSLDLTACCNILKRSHRSARSSKATGSWIFFLRLFIRFRFNCCFLTLLANFQELHGTTVITMIKIKALTRSNRYYPI